MRALKKVLTMEKSLEEIDETPETEPVEFSLGRLSMKI